MPSLRCIDEQQHEYVNRQQHPQRLRAVSRQIARLKQSREGPDKNREVKQKNRITEIRNDLTQKAGAFLIIIGQQLQAVGQSSALFTGMEQRRVKGRQPTAKTIERFAEGSALTEAADQGCQRLAKGARRRSTLQTLQGLRQADAGAHQLAELMIEFGALKQLPGCEEQWHGTISLSARRNCVCLCAATRACRRANRGIATAVGNWSPERHA